MADNTSGNGTPVTVVVPAQPQVPGVPVVPVPTSPRPPLAHTGFELVAALMVVCLLLALGTTLLAAGARRTPHLSRRTS